MQNIVLLFGGKSCEHDISIITAMQTLANVDTQRFNVFPIYISKENRWFLVSGLNEPKDFINFDAGKFNQVYVLPGDNKLYKIGKFKSKSITSIDCALICCHGLHGEDGTLQGLFELSDIPYTSCSVVSSAICMDKVFMKQIFEVNNLPIVDYVFFTKQKFENDREKIFKDIKQRLTFPLIVKPARLGSSIGISKCNNLSELEEAINIAFQFDKKLLIEEVVEHLREINCACIGFNEEIEVSNLDEPPAWTDFYDFNSKYIVNTKLEKQPMKKLPVYIKREIKKIAKFAFRVLDCTGVVRIDFLYNDDTEEIFISEINAVPGSLANFMFEKESFTSLITKLFDIAIKKQKEKQLFKFSYQSKVLENNYGLKNK